jgi:hypothetical protein
MADMMGEFSKYKHRLGVEFSCWFMHVNEKSAQN